jgi:energy-coupling factor transporter ATP-binding protein EcfA2
MTYKLQPWQQKMIMDIESCSAKPGEMVVMMASRGTGKSQMAAFARMFNDILNSNIKLSEIKLDYGSVYGKRYYTAEPVGGNWKEMEAWCTDTFGKHGGAIWGHDPNKAPLPNERWYMNNRKFWFRTEKDRDWFIIRWNS